MAEVDDTWAADSTQALEVTFVIPDSQGPDFITLYRFEPKFTYPIFGDEERIFGYQNLKITLRYHASDMRPNLSVDYTKKFKSVGETEATDVEALMREVLPQVAFEKRPQFLEALRQLPADWTPPGEILQTFAAPDGGVFQIRRGDLSDPTIAQMLNRIQVLVLLFIEGGSIIDSADEDSLDRWEVFFLYHKKPAPATPSAPSYQFIGYSTVYKFFPLSPRPLGSNQPPRDSLVIPTEEFPLSNLESRHRISQFVITPPFQRAGHGPRLYGAIYNHYLKDPNIKEITVEDPNEAFDDMRDMADLAFLRKQAEFNELCVNASIEIPKRGATPRHIVDEEEMERTRLKFKIAPRQFSRVLEMHLMSKLAESVRPSLNQERKTRATKVEKHEYDLWRLFVKQRLYRHNKELLHQLDRSERIDKLNETLGSVELEYVRLLAMFDARNPAERANGKRKLKDIDTDASLESKKARVEDA